MTDDELARLEATRPCSRVTCDRPSDAPFRLGLTREVETP